MRIENVPQSGYSGISMRQLERSDMRAWYAWLSDPDVVRHTSWNLHTEQDLVPMFDAIESTASQSIRRMAIIDDAGGRLIGTIGFHTVSDVNRTAEIAYDLAPAYWGRGIASALCDAVTSWAFLEYGWVRIQGTVLETNARSARVLQKSGFRYEGLLRSYRMVRGTPGNFALYSRLRSD